MTIDGELDFEALQRLTKYERPGDISKCLKKQGVTVLLGKDGVPFTTLAALNRAMGMDHTSGKSTPRIEF